MNKWQYLPHDLWVLGKSTRSELAVIRVLRLRKSSDFFGRLRSSSGIFGNDRVVFKIPGTARIKISRLYLRKSWQVYAASVASIVFYDILARACAEVFGRESDLSIFEFFFRCSFFSFSFLFAAVIGLLLGLLAVKKNFPESVIETCKFDHGVAMCTGRKFAPTFSLNFLSIFVHISGSIRPITLIWWSSLERSYPPDEVGPKWWRQKWKKGPGSWRSVMAGFNNKYQLTKRHPLT